jgi:hypothetical protein
LTKFVKRPATQLRAKAEISYDDHDLHVNAFDEKSPVHGDDGFTSRRPIIGRGKTLAVSKFVAAN